MKLSIQSKHFPMLGTIKNYSLPFFTSDLVSALSTVVVTIPQTMACALLIGINPLYGLYTSVVSIFLNSFFASSEFMITGPTTAIGLLLADAVVKLQPSNMGNELVMLTMIAFIVGVIQLGLGLLRLGKLLNYISHSVMTGFTTGAGVLIGLSQLDKLFGLSIKNGSALPADEKFWTIITHLGQTNVKFLVIALLSIVMVLLFQKVAPRLPGTFFVVIITAVLMVMLGWQHVSSVGDGRIYSMMTGDMTNGLPPFKMLDFSLFVHPSLWSSAFAVAIIGLVEALSISKSLAIRSGTKIDVNQEFIGQGITNMGVSFFRGVVTSGSFSNTAANYQNGAKTRLSATMIGIILGITMLFFAHYAAYIPIPALAGIMMVIAYRLIDQHEIKKLFKTGGVDLLALLVTFACTLILTLEMAVFIGMALTIILYLWNADKASLKLLIPCADSPGQFEECQMNWVETHMAEVLIIQFEGGLYFGSAADMEAKLESLNGHAQGFLLRMKHVNNVDITAIEVLRHFVLNAQKNGAEVMVSGVNQGVFETLKKAGLVELIGEGNFVFAERYLFESTNDALSILHEKISHETPKTDQTS